jgi:acyl-CoA synthetase (AMP-forming)/AMP-acid ligase II
MQGLMQDKPLLISSLLEHAERFHPEAEIISRTVEGPVHRTNWRQLGERSRRLAAVLASQGVGKGTMVATLAWNTHRHLELYFAVMGLGAVLHTINPRLSAEHLEYVVGHAEDEIMFFDMTFAPLVTKLRSRFPTVKRYCALADGASLDAAALPIPGVESYEALLASAPLDGFEWPVFDEYSAASLCYTSGTTGNPKGVLYSHRALVLNAMSGCMPAVLGSSTKDTVLPVVPMFHINAWCIPYGTPMIGARLVLPGPRLDGASLYELMESERVTISAGVPTIWMAMMQYVEQNKLKFSTMRRTLVGGSAMPQALIAKFADEYDVEVRHGWGMTETTAAATTSMLNASDLGLPAAQQHAIVAKQGKSMYGIEIKVVDEAGTKLPRDGISQGELYVRGQWVVSAYYKAEKSALVDGWFPTGDIASIEANGRMQIRDRTKDVIKSGGEWISSIDLENVALAHPAVAMAAVIGVKHPKWEERPLLLIVRKPDAAVERDDILAFLTDRVAKWWIPDEVLFVDALPVGGTGKVQKNELRQKYGGVFA